MTPTRPTVLAVLAVLASTLGWSVAQVFDSVVGRTLPVPWSAPVTLGVLALGILLWAIGLRPRLLRREGARPVSPFLAARTAALAMAASRTGAIVGGFYAGVAVALLADLQNPVAAQRAWAAGAAVLGGLLVVLAALWLEHICRLPGDDDQNKAGHSAGETGDQSPDWVHPAIRG